MSFSDFLSKAQNEAERRAEGKVGQEGPQPPIDSDLQYPLDLFDSQANAQVSKPFVLFSIKDPVEKAKPKRFITMYMPGNLTSAYSADYENEMQISKRFKSFVDSGIQVTKEIGAGVQNQDFSSVVKSGAEVGVALLSDTALGKNLGKEYGIVRNPHQALFFKSVGFREFAFDFHMFARNEKEAYEIENIILSFKHAMHPGTVPGKTIFWTYPDNFDIFLFTPTRVGGQLKETMFRIDTSVLASMDVNYAGSNVPAFFQDTGHAVDIRMKLQFKELSLLTKEKIERKY
jgi:hypothetical protein